MTKAELITAMAEKTGSTKKATAAALDAFTEVIAEAMKAGDKVALVGFGSFEAAERAARKGRNPQTGEEIMIPACKTPKFKAGKSLKDAVR